MATLLSSVNPMTPVTPPPENMNFPRASFEPRTLPPQLKRTADEAHLDNGHYHQAKLSADPLPQPRQPQVPLPPHLAAGPNPPMDPRYVAMLQRIAAYYQQRTQAIANFQHQRCQAWANLHRQKCQDMMQASMLVVAWYIRDRIQRRRRRDKRRFRNGLKEKASGTTKIVRGETVRRWVMAVPDVTLAPTLAAPADSITDPEEAQFNMDHEPTPDKDTKLFEMADNLIRSQYRKVDVPLFGTLNFDDSDHDSESEKEDDAANENELVEEDEADEEEEDEVDYEEDDMEDDEDLYDYEDDEDGDYEVDKELGSELVHNGTGPRSGHNETNSSG